MGACLSCLGLAQESSSDPSDTHPLLNEPYPQHNYGAIGDNARSSPQVDPEEIRRQRDALERLCAATSDKLIDVTQTTRSDEGRAAPPKLATDYPRLFAEQFGSALATSEEDEDETDGRPHSDSTLAEQEEVDQLRQVLWKEGKELATWKKPANLGALSIQFEDLMSTQLSAPASKGKLTS